VGKNDEGARGRGFGWTPYGTPVLTGVMAASRAVKTEPPAKKMPMEGAMGETTFGVEREKN
jgi:hypothetical protein